MREALGGLTVRGRSFLGAGAAAALCALVLPQGGRDLLRVAILVAVLPLACALVVARTRYRIACGRRLSPSRVQAGEQARVVLELDNVSRLPTGLLLVEDKVPYTLGSRPRFVLDRVEPRGRREVAYRVRSDVRGRFVLGPLTVQLTDPFGMCELTRSFTHRDALIVTPIVHSLPTIRLGGEWASSGESNARSVAAAGEDDVATREYRHGDDRRRIHWRSTARYGELMVRREEQPWQSRATVVLDTRERAHRGDGPASSFEWAVSAAASIGMHLAKHGYSAQLITDGGVTLSSTAFDTTSPGGDFEGLLLDTLAVVTTSTNPSLERVGAAIRRSGADGLIIAVLGNVDADEVDNFARMRRGTTTGIAFLLDTASWIHLAEPMRVAERARFEHTSGLLRQRGWRVVPVSAGDPLPALWPQAGRSALDLDRPDGDEDGPLGEPELAAAAAAATAASATETGTGGRS
jgi:uncharacterized protein (DUF58 family)